MQVPFPITTFGDFIKWIIAPTGGSVLFIAWFASWALEPLAWFQKFKSTTRWFFILAISTVFGLGIYLLSLNPILVNAIEPYYQLLIGIIITWLVTQVAHKSDK